MTRTEKDNLLRKVEKSFLALTLMEEHDLFVTYAASVEDSAIETYKASAEKSKTEAKIAKNKVNSLIENS